MGLQSLCSPRPGSLAKVASPGAQDQIGVTLAWRPSLATLLGDLPWRPSTWRSSFSRNATIALAADWCVAAEPETAAVYGGRAE